MCWPKPTIVVVLNFLVLLPLRISAQTNTSTVVPGEISADLGTCSASITVSGTDSKPIYAAKVTTRIQFGLLGVKRLDLEAYTGSDGKVKITNLPEVLKKPMYIHISKGDKEEIVQFKPDIKCEASFDIQLR